jgi:hypothetical protein
VCGMRRKKPPSSSAHLFSLVSGFRLERDHFVFSIFLP